MSEIIDYIAEIIGWEKLDEGNEVVWAEKGTKHFMRNLTDWNPECNDRDAMYALDAILDQHTDYRVDIRLRGGRHAEAEICQGELDDQHVLGYGEGDRPVAICIAIINWKKGGKANG